LVAVDPSPPALCGNLARRGRTGTVMLTTKSAICFCAVGIVLTVFYTTCASKPVEMAGGAEPEKQPEKQIVGVTVRLDRQEACPGETVRVTEVVPASDDLRVIGLGHTVYRIGDYDPKSGRMVNREPEDMLHTLAEKVFDDLPPCEAGTRTREFTMKNPREQGFEIECKPKQIGIYMVVARWHLRDGTKGGSFLYGQPVILVVKPPLDAKGQPIVKPEWKP
jgi:hypothetical protein